MAAYRIDLVPADGCAPHTRMVECAQDDEAIDLAGGLPHPGAIDVRCGERLVAHFPPLPGTDPRSARS